MSNQRPLTIAIVAGEHSGDLLGAGLMRALKERHHGKARFIGVGGPLMQAQGLSSFFPMDDLAIMGIAEVLKHLPKLLKHRRQLVDYLKQQQPDVMIGIDAPDFTLTVEKRLKNVGIPTVHYVSPSVWAWREGRIKGIKQAVNHMLCLLPFEKQFYDKHQLPATFVGHPLADDIPLQWSKDEAREQLNLPQSGNYLALLPGSRGGEIERMAPVFLAAASRLQEKFPALQLVAPMINQARADQFLQIKQRVAPQLSVAVRVGDSRTTMAAADYLLLTSGTVALEAMLIKRPMVVAYKFNALTYRLIKWLFHAPFFSLPNLLAGEAIVPELAQQDASVDALVEQLNAFIENDNDALLNTFATLHHQLKADASQRAADVVLSLANEKHSTK